jgi:polysaccharide biosynthesis protein PslG
MVAARLGSVVARALSTLALGAALLAISAGTAAAAPPPGFVGMTADDLYGFAGDYREKNLGLQRTAGVQLLRVTFSWRAIEYEPGKVDYTNYDRYVLDAARNGITLLPVLFDPPDWRQNKPARRAKRGTYPPRSFQEMADWAVPLVDRYGPNGTLWQQNPNVVPRPITAWQVWNEPTLPVYWQPKPNIKQYVSLLRTVGSAIKARDPNAEIVTAGMPPSFQKGAVRLIPALTQLYRAGGSSAFDTLAINSYATSDKSLGKLMNQVRSLMNKRGGRADKIWITELGWCDKGVKNRFCVGTRKQTKYILGSLKLMKKKRQAWKLRGFVYFSWRDGRPYVRGGRDQWGFHTGLLSLGGKKKPAYNAFVRGVSGL